MYDANWPLLLNIHTESVFALVLFLLIIGVQEWLIVQKKYPTFGTLILMLAPFQFLALFYFFVFINHSLRFADIFILVCITASLPLGLIYSVRFSRVDYIGFPWTGRIFSFVFLGLILWMFLSCLNTTLSNMLSGFTIPDYLLLFIYLSAAVLWTAMLRKLGLLPRRKRRHKSFLCMECGYSLEGSMNAVNCPECGKEIEPQNSPPTAACENLEV